MAEALDRRAGRLPFVGLVTLLLRRRRFVVAAALLGGVVTLGWGDAEWGIDEWGSPPVVVIYTDEGHTKRLKPAIEEVLAMWEAELTD